MGFITTIIIGFVVGLVARFLMPGRDPAGFIVTAALGIIGALVAKYLGQAIGMYGPEEPAGFVMSVVGAMILLFIYRRVGRGSVTTTNRKEVPRSV